MNRKIAQSVLIALLLLLVFLGSWASMMVAEGGIEEKFHWAVGLMGSDVEGGADQHEEHEHTEEVFFVEGENPILYLILTVVTLAFGVLAYVLARRKTA